MDGLCIALISCVVACCALAKSIVDVDADKPVIFDVREYGAAGDGETDDTQAFAKAWDSTCGTSIGTPVMVIPMDRTFLVMPIIFKGPCKAKNVNVMIDGTLVSHEDPDRWTGLDTSLWLQFMSINGLNVFGSGQLNGRGFSWWSQSCKINPKKGCTTLAPTVIKFKGCNDLTVKNLQLVDSPQTHLSIQGSCRVDVMNLNITAPGDSPNTDGIHIHACQHVVIQNTKIGTGDDCISIGDRTFDIVITRIICGPGHGISVGSLGKGGSNVSVENIHVSFANIFNTTNGARIKTWQGATGFAKSITFEHLRFNNVKNPIIIDQNYCAKDMNCSVQQNAVQISDVRYAYCAGTSKTDVAINLNCSQNFACTGIEFDHVDIPITSAGKQTSALCNNAYIHVKGYVSPEIVDCAQTNSSPNVKDILLVL